ncbi:MAG TPA: helix-turn-helix transcriptional regulator [Alphaproteobacteria bacterium]|jgi:transcriptional regulator with XRE-family HTH domain|nr:helix-turn-helix transcriptional regulator [Alphaproteobacteria bacterium]
MSQLGEKIKKARITKEITQEDLAKAIGVSDKSISAYESGRVSPPIVILRKISAETSQPLNYFLEEKAELSVLSKLEKIERDFEEIKRLLKEGRGN